MAYTRVTMAQVAFPQILFAFDAVGQWVNQQGRTMSAAPHEVYFADLSTPSPNGDICEIAFPIAG